MYQLFFLEIMSFSSFRFPEIQDMCILSIDATLILSCRSKSKKKLYSHSVKKKLQLLQNIFLLSTLHTLSWTFGIDGNAEIAGVNISYTAIANYRPSDDRVANGSVSTTDRGQTSIIINRLQPLTTYNFTVRVRNTVSDEVGEISPVSVTADTLPMLGECTVC